MKNKNQHDQSSALLKQYLMKVHSLRYFYIIFVVLFTAFAFLYNRISPKIYQISSTIGPVQDNRSSILSSNNMFQSLGAYKPGINIEDDINSLSSFTLIASTVNKMNLEVGYYAEKNSLLKQSSEIYLRSPFHVLIDKSHIQPIMGRFYITIISDSTFRLKISENKTTLYNYIDNQIIRKNVPVVLDTICKFNKTITSKYFKFSISVNKEFDRSEFHGKYQFFFQLFHPEELSKAYVEMLKIEPISLMASLIRIQFQGENIEKSISFLNNYISIFLEESLSKTNKIALNTMNFIDSQISEISDSLVMSESKLKNFRTTNQVTDLSFQGQRIYEQLEQIETDKTNLEVQSRYYNYVLNYFKTNQDMSGVVPPSSSNITDPILDRLITDLVALNAERSSILNNSKGKNIFLSQIENKIKSQKQAIIENVTNNLNTANLTLNALNYRAEKLSAEISNLPRTEMNMVNIQRKFNLNDAIYSFLLQKRSEAAISLASNVPEFEVLEPARIITSEIVKPKTMLNFLIALFLAMMLPTLYLVLSDFFYDRFSSVFDIERVIDRQLMGIIYSNGSKSDTIVVESPRSAIAESFRQLRSNLLHKLKSDQSKVILVTSSQPGDGKSFISVNLAASIASMGQKTILIDCDLRHPSAHDKLKLENLTGLSNYMTKTRTIDEITLKTQIDNLFFIPAGPILANSSELLETGALDDLVSGLKEEYSYILIDSPPVGLVADANRLMKYASHILVVSRNNFTSRTILANVINSLDSRRIENYDVVFNDLNLKDSPYSNYSNYYLKE